MIVATVAVAVAVLAAVLAALGGVAAEASFPVYFSAAKTRLAPVDNYIVRSEGVLYLLLLNLGLRLRLNL